MAQEDDKQTKAGDTGTPVTPAAPPGGKGGSEKRGKSRAAASKPPPGGKPGRRFPLAVLLAVLALLVALGAGGAAYYLWQQLTQVHTSLQQEQRAGKERVAALRSDLDQRNARLQEQQLDLGKRQQTVQVALSAVRQLVGRDRDGWVLAEVEYLILVANHRLQLQRDVPTAIAALGIADQRLKDLGDPGLTPVRERLAREISALKVVARPDIEGMALRLDGLAQQADQLHAGSTKANRSLAGTAAEGGGTGKEGQKGWSEALRGVWKELKTLVVIRRHDQPVSPLLSPEQEFLSRQVLRLKLEAARVALLERDPALFSSSVRAAEAWLRSRFDHSDPTVAGMLEQLQQLAAVDIRPSLPDISGSLRMLRQIVERRKSEVAPQPQLPPQPADTTPPAQPPQPDTPGAQPAPAAPGSGGAAQPPAGEPQPAGGEDHAPPDQKG